MRWGGPIRKWDRDVRPGTRRLVAVAVASAGVLATASAAAAGVHGHRGNRHHAAHIVSTHATRPLRTALFDPYSFVGASSVAYAMAAGAGASYVRLPFNWSSVAPAVRPPGFVASDPSSPDYSWAGLDRMVVAAEAAGLTPILDVVKPPQWAYAVPPHRFSAGTPRKNALHQFAKALAAHYDGQNGAPRVRIFQVWNEPNNSLDLTPVKPSNYRRMVNAFASGVRSVDSRDLIVAGGLDPFKNKAKRFHTMAPLAFMRRVLCISMGNPKAKKAKLREPHATCRAKAYFDAWSTHPYTFDGPFGHARFADDVSLGDLPKMRKLLRTAVKLHRIVSTHRNKVQFWVTEFSWDTNPPRRGAAPLKLQARWTSEALYQMWRSGVSLVTWFMLQDRPSPSPYQSGLYFYASSLAKARAKPTRQAFRFPFVAYLGQGRVQVWGRDATSTKQLVTIQRRHRHGRWRTVARIRSNRSGIFKATLKLKATKRDWLRARAAGSGSSLAFSLKVPKNQRYGPWGN